MSDPTILILSSLAEGDKHGYAMMEDIERIAGVRLGPGTLYGAITRLEQYGWIRPVSSSDRRQPYTLTAAGRAYLDEQLQQLDKLGRDRLEEAKARMKLLTRLAARLYPKPWRDRYGAEFAALLEDVKPDSRASLDIVKGALLMQMTGWNAGRILVVGGLLGALAAFGASYLIPKTYVSQAVVKTTPARTSSIPAADVDREVTDRINEISQNVFSRTALTTIIQRFGLYQGERSRMPLEDVIELMRKNIAILPIQRMVGSPPPRVPAVAIQFSYQDPRVAQMVTQELVSRYIDQNMSAGAHAFAPITLELLDPASLPFNPVSPRPLRITTMGLALGLTLGAIVAYVQRTPQPMLASAGILRRLRWDARLRGHCCPDPHVA